MQINFTINNKKYTFAKKYNILQVCNEFDITIPKFCYHEKLTIAGNCRMCLIEVKGSMKPVPACALPISENLEIFTESKLVKKAREGILEFILLNHPLDCPICDQGGECDLQDQALIYGNDKGRFYDLKKTALDINCGYLIKTVMTRCIQCTRCIRFTKEIAGIRTLGIINRGVNMEISTFLNKIYKSEVSGNVIDLCPVGALTSNPYSFIARPWELKSFNTIDVNDGSCVNIRIDIRNIDILRIIPRYNKYINDVWISDVTRFSFDAFKVNRILMPFLKDRKVSLHVSWSKVLRILRLAKYDRWFHFVCGNFLDFELIFVLKKFATKLGRFTINSVSEKGKLNNDFRDRFLFPITPNCLGEYANIVLIGVNLRFENPIFNVQIKNLVNKNLITVYNVGSSYNYNYTNWNLGNRVNELFLFLEGKSVLVNIFQRFGIKNLILCGATLLLRNDFLLVNLMKTVQNTKIFIVNNFLTNNGLNDLNFHNALGKFQDETLKMCKESFKYKFLYLLNTDSIFFNSVPSQFVVYQGHHNVNWLMNNSLFKKLNYLLLPTCAFFEKKGLFLNFFGIYQKTRFILAPPKKARNDWKILNALYILYFRRYLFRMTGEICRNILNDYNCQNLMQNRPAWVWKNHHAIYICYKITNTVLNSYITNNFLFNQILKASKILRAHRRLVQTDYCTFA